uniref:Androgen induced inhibitor of proliferation (As3) / pds5, putative n=1 Tax=Arundo donax TaxID=35708 RepID=A0A0A9ET20_ARUDO
MSVMRSSHSRSNITTHARYLATVSRIATLRPKDWLLTSLSPLNVPTIR